MRFPAQSSPLMKQKGFPHNGKPFITALAACQNITNPEKTGIAPRLPAATYRIRKP
ncbi:hypothetical protein BN439_3353 [Erwinia amylovora Ea644]|nr:hypothetical protein BN439_3353 [Erwinia amylovora Ea644]